MTPSTVKNDSFNQICRFRAILHWTVFCSARKPFEVQNSVLLVNGRYQVSMINQVLLIMLDSPARKQEIVTLDPPVGRLLIPTGFPPMLFQIFNLDVVRLLLHITVIFKHI